MDSEKTTTRTTSQSSLRSVRKGQGQIRHSNTCQGFSRPSSQRTLLRAVNNNVSLLKPPGPLESMLKTTTETGDIGLFTIGGNTSPTTYHQPSRSRPLLRLEDVPLARPAHSRRYQERDYSKDDRMRLPSSYRDTTSEILSLYGSEAHQSRTFTPSNDDAQRSYSLTTCSSRHLPSQKSSATLQSLSSTSGLQRPRSPFPYPTRLKRPGARPASPAVTENGAIDYSRMVELDRSYQRQVHGGHRPPHTYNARRPPPLALRSEANRSTSSLPSRSSPGAYGMSPSPYRTRTPTSHRTRTPRPSDRSRSGSNEQGFRSPSLTSIVEMYQRPATVNSSGPPLRSTGSFYYDYSEEFEKHPSHLIEPEIPLCPIPQRAPSLSRPMVLRAEEKGSLDEMDNEKENGRDKDLIATIPEEGSVEEHAKGSIGIALPRQQIQTIESSKPNDMIDGRNVNGADDSLGVTETQCQASRGADTQNSPSELAVTKVEHQAEDSPDVVAPQIPAISQERHRLSSFDNSALGTTILSPGKRCRRSKTIGARVDDGNHISTNKRGTYSSLRKLRNTLDPNLFEFASLLTSFDRLAKSPFSKRGESGASSEETEQLIRRTSQSHNEDVPQTVLVEVGCSPRDFENIEKLERPFHKRHRRNLAATRISTTNITKPSNDNVAPQDGEKALDILSPTPISPTRQLKVKNSIPQLMKALPPLPAEAEKFDNDGCSTRETTTTSEEVSSGGTSNKLGGVERAHACVDSQPEASPPKLKLRVKPLPSTPVPSDDAFDIPLSENPSTLHHTGSPAQRKLKIKICRNPAVPTHTSKDGTVFRSPALKQCNSLADLEHCARKDIFTSQCRLQKAFSNPMAESEQDGGPMVSAQNTGQAFQLDTKRPELPGNAENMEALSPSRRRDLRRTRSMVLGTEQGEHQGLRQKLSFLRLRLRATQDAREAKHEETLFPFSIRGGPGSSPAASPEQEMKRFRPGVAKLRSGNAKRRVRRWAKGAKNAMRRAMRKTLDRSASLTT